MFAEAGWLFKARGKAHYFAPAHSLCWAYDYAGRWFIAQPPDEQCCARCLKRFRYRQAHGRLP